MVKTCCAEGAKRGEKILLLPKNCGTINTMQLPSSMIPVLLKKGKRVTVSSMTAYVMDSENTLWQVIVPKKTASTAVARHKLKRRLKEALKKINWGEHSILFISRKTTQNFSLAQLKDDCSIVFGTIFNTKQKIL